tara:strand:+ start:49 stop:312 length:264 start_codon:yes stop_codon:yes gene_type:complete
LLTDGRTRHAQDQELDEAKVKAAIKAQKKRESKEGAETDDRKRKYNSGATYEVTAEEMEAHYRQKKRDTTGDMADPMAGFKDDEEDE